MLIKYSRRKIENFDRVILHYIFQSLEKLKIAVRTQLENTSANYQCCKNIVNLQKINASTLKQFVDVVCIEIAEKIFKKRVESFIFCLFQSAAVKRKMFWRPIF